MDNHPQNGDYRPQNRDTSGEVGSQPPEQVLCSYLRRPCHKYTPVTHILYPVWRFPEVCYTGQDNH